MNTLDIVIPTCILSLDRHVAFVAPVKIPEWAVRWNNPELQSAGRPKIDIGTIASLSGHKGITRPVNGLALLEIIADNGLMKDCLNLTDGTSIAAYEYCHSIFKGKKVFLWQSVALDNYGNMFVPFIQSIRSQTPLIYWLWLEYDIHPNSSLGLLSN